MANVKDLLVNGSARVVGTIYGNSTSANKLSTNAGSASQPVYFNNGVPVAITGTIANNAASASKVNNKLTIGSKTFDGSAAVTIAASDLGLASAMLFLGTTTTAITDGTTTNPVLIGGANKTVTNGNVVLYGSKEFVWTGSAWEELGNEGSYKIVQSAVGDPSASGTSNTFIATISQDTNGKITATKKTVGTANSANKLATARTITLSGAVTGSASFDGSKDITITTTGSQQTLPYSSSTSQLFITSTANQANYTLDNFIDNAIYHVYVNGFKIPSSEYTVSSSGVVTLDNPPELANQEVEIVANYTSYVTTDSSIYNSSYLNYYRQATAPSNTNALWLDTSTTTSSSSFTPKLYDGGKWNAIGGTDTAALTTTLDTRYVKKSGDTVTGDLTAPTFHGSLDGNAASANSANYLPSQGVITAISGTSRYPTGLRFGRIYNSGYPFSYGTTITMENGAFGAELIFNGLGGGGATGSGDMRFRTHSDWTTSEWGQWRTILDSSNYASYTSNKVTNGGSVTTIRALTQSEHDAIGSKDGNTLYVIR